MAIAITNTTQLSLFDSFVSAITANATLAAKFNTNNIYQYEPKHKAMSFKGFPYFWVNIPSKEDGKVVFDNNFTEPNFVVTVFMRVDWDARSKVLGYANAFLKACTDYESSFQASGYYDVMAELLDVGNVTLDSKEIIEAVFEVSFHGVVNR